MITIAVFYKSTGKPAKGKRVATSLNVGHEYADEKGEAHFNLSPKRGKVYVDGHEVYQGQISGRVVVYV